MDEFEVRSRVGWHHHITLALLAGAFLLTLQQDWGKKMPQVTPPRVYRVVREMLKKEEDGDSPSKQRVEALMKRMGEVDAYVTALDNQALTGAIEGAGGNRTPGGRRLMR